MLKAFHYFAYRQNSKLMTSTKIQISSQNETIFGINEKSTVGDFTMFS